MFDDALESESKIVAMKESTKQLTIEKHTLEEVYFYISIFNYYFGLPLMMPRLHLNC